MANFGNSQILLDMIHRRKAGEMVGIPSVCSANPFVIDAAMVQARELGTPLLIEATCNQVNQFGGYSGMRPADFAAAVAAAADKAGLPTERIVLGGDHLGPYPWRNEPAPPAMGKAIELVQEFARAGFAKLHLDASMPCGGEDSPAALAPHLIADRTAVLCEAAETALPVRGGKQLPVYVVGTEVPPPGGSTISAAGPHVTTAGEAAQNIEAFRESMQRHGLMEAWERVIALVVDPGIEFEDQVIRPYDAKATSGLTKFIASLPGIVYEAHSTDYQSPESLKAMVEDQFSILKVGPALTFALREVLFALARIETECLGGRTPGATSSLVEKVDAAMKADPSHWTAYYRGGESETALARKYSRLDRIRYYWSVPGVAQALGRLIANLEEYPVPSTLLSQYLPVQYQRIQAGVISNNPRDLIRDHITATLRDYAVACGQVGTSDV